VGEIVDKLGDGIIIKNPAGLSLKSIHQITSSYQEDLNVRWQTIYLKTIFRPRDLILG